MTERLCGGILLYYKYVDLALRQEEVKEWFLELCEGLKLRGRIRVAKDGVNCTVGGSLDSLRDHIRTVRCHDLFGDDIDFKLAASQGPASEQAAVETGFKSLSVSICEEVVSLHHAECCSPAQLPQASAPHASPQEFHSIIARAEQHSHKETVLLDVRNYYETRVGSFQKEGVTLIDPRLRCFGDLTSWLNHHAAELAGRTVLMYCTGGVRCERASAYLRSKGSAFQDVVQLQGGIQRYMEAFPDGGFFVGRNFVFDERVTVGVEAGKVLGSCLACSSPHDTYEPRRRCRHCRMLVLVCPACAAKGADAALLCELCLEKGVQANSISSVAAQLGSEVSHEQASALGGQSGSLSPVGQNSSVTQQADDSQLCMDCCQAALHCDPSMSNLRRTAAGQLDCSPSACHTEVANREQPKAGQARRLRILCLHGFRQSASSLQGRTAALARKLGDLAELVYIDAPHPLPFVRKHLSIEEASDGGEGDVERGLQPCDTASRGQGRAKESTKPQRCHGPCEGQCKIDCSSERWMSEACQSSPSIAPRACSGTAAGTSPDGDTENVPAKDNDTASAEPQPQPQQKHYRRAWLLEPGQVPVSQALAKDDLTDTGVCLVPTMNTTQHKRQTEGWHESWEALKAAMDLHGPIDGMMGFSQGAAIAAALCAIQQETCRGAPPQKHCSQGGRMRFAVCCSGYPSPVHEHQQHQKTLGSIRLPSLHVYGAKDEDRQIPAQESRALAEQFDITQRYVIEHSSGHVLPSSKAVVNRIRDFLKRHVGEAGLGSADLS